ncbi:NADH dehydrogenase [ubiquinone] iron-sulfur protein 6, mitochondrial-like [Lineus longissimus]|uniref:NADH dehydrogenase [ubiquinone] iron-sulfur protein 6, mitochondrial-like n=1 Tax=Lineus longissimus TaxID=88925 RepID=UPI002B4DCECA
MNNMANFGALKNFSRFSPFIRNVRLNRAAFNQGARSMTSQDTREDEMTHTGQKFEKDDVRLVRFVDKSKLVNKQYAIDLIDEIPPKACEERVVSCDGGGGALGHPKVYINLDQPGNHACGYCGLRFFKDDHH